MINNFKKICICRSVTGGTIMKSIREGKLTFESLRRSIRIGTGTCKAKRCRPKVEELLTAYKESLDKEDKSSQSTQPNV